MDYKKGICGKIDINRFDVDTAGMQRFTDIVMDTMKNLSTANPVVTFFSDELYIIEDSIQDSFRFFIAFGEYNKMYSTAFIRKTRQTYSFWLRLYKIFDPENIKNSCKEILTRCVQYA